MVSCIGEGVGQLQHLLCGRHTHSDGSVVRSDVEPGSGDCYILVIFAFLMEEYLECLFCYSGYSSSGQSSIVPKVQLHGSYCINTD